MEKRARGATWRGHLLMFQSAHEPPPPTCSLPARRKQITKIRLRDRIQSYARTRRPALRLAVQNDGTPAAPNQVSGQVSSDPCCAMIAYASSSLTSPPRNLDAQINEGPRINSTDCLCWSKSAILIIKTNATPKQLCLCHCFVYFWRLFCVSASITMRELVMREQKSPIQNIFF